MQTDPGRVLPISSIMKPWVAARPTSRRRQGAVRHDNLAAKLKDNGVAPEEIEIATNIERCTRDPTKSWLQHMEETGSTMSISEWAKGELERQPRGNEAQARALGRVAGVPTTK